MKKTINLLPNRKEFCVLIKSAFSNRFCNAIINEKKSLFKKANTHYPTSYRNNERYIDNNNQLSEKMFSIIHDYIPEKITINGISDYEKGDWKLKKLNSRIRICRYLPNQYFHKHLDGVFYQSEKEQSKLTFMIYLNSHDEFKGGKTLFFNSKESDEIIGSYKPVKGDLIIFDHNLWHSGETITQGEKYIVRSDIIYKKVNTSSIINKKLYQEGHLGYIWNVINFNNHLITCGRDKKIKIWNKNGEKTTEVLAHENSIINLLNLNNRLLVSTSRDTSIKIWDFTNLKEIGLKHTLKFHKGTVLTVCKKNNNEFLSGGADGIINKISKNGILLKKMKAHNEWIWGLSIINDHYFASISEDGSLVLWCYDTFQKILCWKGNQIPINSITVDDKHIYLGRFDGKIIQLKIDFERKQIQKIKELKCHNGIIRKLMIDKKTLYSASEDNTVKLWNKYDFKFIKEFKHNNFVQDITIYNHHLISVSYDGQILKHERPE